MLEKTSHVLLDLLPTLVNQPRLICHFLNVWLASLVPTATLTLQILLVLLVLSVWTSLKTKSNTLVDLEERLVQPAVLASQLRLHACSLIRNIALHNHQQAFLVQLVITSMSAVTLRAKSTVMLTVQDFTLIRALAHQQLVKLAPTAQKV